MKTNRTLKLITLTAAIFGFAATSFGQNSATSGVATAGARIIAPITIGNLANLYFGYIVKTSGTNDIILDANSSATRHPSVASSIMTTQTGTPTAAQFSVTGEDDFTYAVTLPSSITLAGPTGSTAMTVDTFTTNLTNDKGTIGEENSFYVGAILHVNAGQAVGNYAGEFTVTVAYE
ncbi:MAG: DUF4402 domain-containing protein [Paludibacter sp.]|nr:DUF4402 domain-containing protein [Paludibacter sp.]